MSVINRDAITITYKKPFVEWHNKLFNETNLLENMIGESTTFLIKAGFDNADKAIKKYYKVIFEAVLEGVWTDENDWPQKRNWKTFNEWFTYEISDWVVDLVEK